MDDGVCHTKQRARVGMLSGESHPVGHAEVEHETLEVASQRPLAEHDERDVWDACDSVHGEVVSLLRGEATNRHDESKAGSQLPASVGRIAVSGRRGWADTIRDGAENVEPLRRQRFCDTRPTRNDRKPSDSEQTCGVTFVAGRHAMHRDSGRHDPAAPRGECGDDRHSGVVAMHDVGLERVDGSMQPTARKRDPTRTAPKNRQWEELDSSRKLRVACARDRGVVSCLDSRVDHSSNDALGAARAQLLDHLQDTHGPPLLTRRDGRIVGDPDFRARLGEGHRSK
jgi:hypothetical protein